jgi:hypothetical protein
MTKFISYMSDEAIEKDAQGLLAEYACVSACKIDPLRGVIGVQN